MTSAGQSNLPDERDDQSDSPKPPMFDSQPPAPRSSQPYPQQWPPLHGQPPMPMYSTYHQGHARMDPLTGELLSAKSKTTAGLLQIFLGMCFIGGIGRMYSGQMTIGVSQLLACLVGLFIAGLIVTIPLTVAAWAWVIADGIFILTGKAQDGQGLYMRN